MSKAAALIESLEFCKQVSSDKWIARCPAHEDKSPSLSVKELQDGRVLIHCHAGCGANEILDSIGLDYGALFPEDNNYSPVTRRKERGSYCELFVAIAQDAMKKGQKLTGPEKQQYIEAKLRMASNG